MALPAMVDGDAMLDFDHLAQPGEPCPRCGSLEMWDDTLGRRRCGECERATLDRAIRWADRAARLRLANLPKPKMMAV
jgi:hypothetical protein